VGRPRCLARWVAGLIAIGAVMGCGDALKPRAGESTAASSPAPSAPSSSSATSSDVPTLGQKVGTFIDGEGFGDVRPQEVFNGGDPTGRVQAIKWESWGDPQATGHGTGWWVGPDQSVADGGYEPARIVAFNLGRCNSALMYQAVEWFFPLHGERFDPTRYEDVCTGQYVDLTCLSYSEATEVFQATEQSSDSTVNDIICHGSSWAVGSVATVSGDIVGAAAFHRVDDNWEFVASFTGPYSTPPSPSAAAYCNALIQQGAPTDMQCQT
jgi:hypothetical protein